jgi:hypothetical protein
MRINLGYMIIVFSIVFLASCAPTIETQPMTADELSQSKAFAVPMVANLMANMLTRDYETFSKDFNPTMHDVMAKSNFEDMMKTFDEKIGTCSNPAFSSGIMMNGNYALTYNLTCQKDTGVQMQVLFEPDDPHLIAGLFFTSPKLQQ